MFSKFWVCHYCGTENKDFTTLCEVCDREKQTEIKTVEVIKEVQKIVEVEKVVYKTKTNSIVTVLLLVSCLIIGIGYIQHGILKNQYDDLSLKHNIITTRYKNLQERIVNLTPFVICSISFEKSDGAVEMNKKKFSLYEGEYIKPVLTIIPMVEESQTITLFVKVFRNNQSLITNEKSPQGFTYESKVRVTPLTQQYITVGAWNSRHSGSRCRIEIWYSGNLIRSEVFTVW